MSPRTASRIVTRLTPNRSHKRSSLGNLTPTGNSPPTIARRRSARTISASDVRLRRERPGSGLSLIAGAANHQTYAPIPTQHSGAGPARNADEHDLIGYVAELSRSGG